jgi:hypothetical protein
VRAELDPKVGSEAALAVTALGETHLAFPDPADKVVLFGRRAPGEATFGTFEPLAKVCSDFGLPERSTPSLTSSADGVVHLVFCAQDADGKRAFRYFTRAPGGAVVEPSAPPGEAGVDPIALTGADGALHLFYTHEGRVRYAHRPRGGAWAEPETVHAGARVAAAALDGSALTLVHVAGPGIDRTRRLARRVLGSASPWREVTLPPPDVELGAVGSIDDAGLALLPDGRAIVVYNYVVREYNGSDDRYNVDAYLVSPDGSERVFKRLSSTVQRNLSIGNCAYDIAVNRDGAGRVHVITSSQCCGLEDDPYRALDVVYDGEWREATPVATAPLAAEAPRRVVLTSAESGLHLRLGSALFERCL